uniref:Laminin G domain-containing protein n=1 Tax=Melopsittacus undulatus TaxID=13146 RepID=A0A8V5GTR3_MELUD
MDAEPHSLWMLSPIPALPVDVLRALGMQHGRDGVSITTGLCPRRPGTPEPDLAFHVDNSTRHSAPTHRLFPDPSFPSDFSILATVRVRRGTHPVLLSVHDERGAQHLQLGLSPMFLYEDQDGTPPPEQYPTFHGLNLADGRWHRVALAVEGTNVSLLVDCGHVATMLLGPRPLLSTKGVTVFGGRLMDEERFEGDIQQLLVLPEPEAARSYCQLHMPDCHHPLRFPLQAPFPEDVSIQTPPPPPSIPYVCIDPPQFPYRASRRIPFLRVGKGSARGKARRRGTRRWRSRMRPLWCAARYRMC